MAFDRGRALVIGVANYIEISCLPGAVLNDAKDIASVLQSSDYCGFPASNIQLLLDDKATLSAIRSALSALALSTTPEDTVVIFFSGHGARIGSGVSETSGIAPVDCSSNNLNGTLILEAELSTALNAINAKRLLVLIDACHSGGAGVLKNIQNEDVRLGFDEKTLQNLAQGVGRVIIASSRASETSLVLGSARNSVFSERLIEALKGKARTIGDGLIRVFDVFNYISEKVQNTVPGRQHPIFKASNLEDNFPIALDRGGAKSLISGGLIQPREAQGLENIMAALYPVGPTDQEIWARAGGDISRLNLGSTGRASWFSAIRMLRQGGGGTSINLQSLLKEALDDFPQHPELISFYRKN